jgi:hypothetical protein
MNSAIPAPNTTGKIEGGGFIFPFSEAVIVAGLKLSVRIGSDPVCTATCGGPCKTAFSGILIITPPCRTDILYYYTLDYYFYFLNKTNNKTNAPPMYIYVEVLVVVGGVLPLLGASGSLGSGLYTGS